MKPLILYCVFLLLTFFNVCMGDYPYQLSICAIFQNEAPYLKEWIEFHRLQGVEHFYLYNHCSTDHYQQVLRPYIQSGIVELQHKKVQARPIKEFNALQCRCYTECLKKATGQSKWIAFLDIDEYLCPTQEQSLLAILKEFEGYGGVCVNWRIFGTSHVKKIPSGTLLIESLTKCTRMGFPLNLYVKSIVRPERTSHFTNPHFVIYKDEFFQVNMDKLPFQGNLSPYIRAHKLRINHYWTRDEEFLYKRKFPRQMQWWGFNPHKESILLKTNEEKDTLILRYVSALKKSVEN
jgi:hypothetical protein